MQITLVVLMIIVLMEAIAFIWASRLSHGVSRNKTQFHDLAPKQSIVNWLILLFFLISHKTFIEKN